MSGTVFYRRLINLGNFENETIGFELPMELNESYADALARVKAIVMELASKTEDNRKAEQRKYKLEHEAYAAEQKLHSAHSHLREAVQKHDELRDILTKHGVEIAALDDWYRPKDEPEAVQSDDEDEDDQDWSEEEAEHDD